ncbi:DUF481 domain-containing protein [Cryomorphaceae bacterium 1068]|nr:DUF481 domain-containing protein [Cryomorphaceae bacterium 1068]
MKKLFYCLLFFPFWLSAQTSKSDTLASETDSLKLKASLSLTGIFQSGNVETIIFRAKSDIAYKPWNKWLFNNRNSYLYQEFDRDKADLDIVSLNFLYFTPDATWSPLLIGIISSNFRRKIDLRTILGAGVTYELLRDKEDMLKFSVSSEYESTNFSRSRFNLEEYNGSESINTLRGTFWINGKHYLFEKKLIAGYEAYFQQSLEESNNFRWQADLSLEMPISKFINFKVNYLHTYESIVVADQKQQDRFLTFGFTFKNY